MHGYETRCQEYVTDFMGRGPFGSVGGNDGCGSAGHVAAAPDASAGETRYDARRSVAGQCAAMAGPLTKLLSKDHYGAKLPPAEFERLVIWMDTYGQRSGSHNPRQEEELRQLRTRLTPLLTLSENR